MFSISIALFKNKEPVLGVVYLPFMKELFIAEKGKGSFLNDEKISVSKTDSLKKSLVATGFPYEVRERSINYLTKIAKVAQGIRRSGSAAVDICYIAAGRSDAYYELGLKIMDTAAAQLILSEAGGKVTDFRGDKIKNDFTKIVASNGFVHDELIKVLGE
jgi:myo-inositol-1(or 4)-monophosphatase